MRYAKLVQQGEQVLDGRDDLVASVVTERTCIVEACRSTDTLGETLGHAPAHALSRLRRFLVDGAAQAQEGHEPVDRVALTTDTPLPPRLNQQVVNVRSIGFAEGPAAAPICKLDELIDHLLGEGRCVRGNSRYEDPVERVSTP